MLGLSFSAVSESGNPISLQKIETASRSQVSIGLPHWTIFVISEPQSITLIPHNHSETYLDWLVQPLIASLYQIVEGERVAYYEPTRMDTGQVQNLIPTRSVGTRKRENEKKRRNEKILFQN